MIIAVTLVNFDIISLADRRRNVVFHTSKTHYLKKANMQKIKRACKQLDRLCPVQLIVTIRLKLKQNTTEYMYLYKNE
jgi:hypothetical protein